MTKEGSHTDDLVEGYRADDLEEGYRADGLAPWLMTYGGTQVQRALDYKVSPCVSNSVLVSQTQSFASVHRAIYGTKHCQLSKLAPTYLEWLHVISRWSLSWQSLCLCREPWATQHVPFHVFRKAQKRYSQVRYVACPCRHAGLQTQSLCLKVIPCVLDLVRLDEVSGDAGRVRFCVE